MRQKTTNNPDDSGGGRQHECHFVESRQSVTGTVSSLLIVQ